MYLVIQFYKVKLINQRKCEKPTDEVVVRGKTTGNEGREREGKRERAAPKTRALSELRAPENGSSSTNYHVRSTAKKIGYVNGDPHCRTPQPRLSWSRRRESKLPVQSSRLSSLKDKPQLRKCNCWSLVVFLFVNNFFFSVHWIQKNFILQVFTTGHVNESLLSSLFDR